MKPSFRFSQNVLASRKLTIENLNEWPIFRAMREDPEFSIFILSQTLDSGEHAEEGEDSVH
jgi:hypothetical protein